MSDTQKIIRELKKTKVFGTLSEAELKEIAPYFTESKHRKKEAIFSEGDPPERFYIVAEGKVKITKLSHEGKELILEVISSSDIFGGIAAVRGFPYPANAVAMEDSDIIRVSRTDLLRIIDRFPQVMYCIAQSLGDRIKDSHETLKNIALERVESRIASLLLKLSDKAGEKFPDGSVAIEMKLTKQDIADMVGTTVETSIRTISKLKKQGLITEKSGRIVIKKPGELRNLAG